MPFANGSGPNGDVPCGLVFVNSDDDAFPVPLKSVSVTASVVHAVAEVEIVQVYKNLEKDPIEVIYIFPLDSNGAVTKFSAELDGKVIKGLVKSSEDAKKDYDKAVKKQQTAFLGEEVKADVFKMKIGSLKPGAETKVVIGYVTEVKNDPDSHAVRFFIPTTVAPRYVPETDNDPKSKDLAKMSFSNSAPAPMNIKVIVNIQGEIEAVESLSGHNILVEGKGPIPEHPSWNKTVVTLAGNVTDMDRDFVLLVTPTEAVMKPRVYYEMLDNGSMAAMTHLIPSFALKEEKMELIIVVDRSGSMGGQSIRMASDALQLFIHSLPSDCFFNIVGFGSSHKFLFRESRKYGQESLREAIKYSQNLKADMGGTEILKPLKAVYSKSHIAGYLRQVFVITDGEVSNTDEVIGLVKRNAHNSRLFALGIGASSSHHLVQGMASAGRGTCAFVEEDESIQRATLSQLKNSLQPALNEVRVEWLGIVKPPCNSNTHGTLFGHNKPQKPGTNTGTFSQSPKNIPSIFDGNQMVAFGIFSPDYGRPTGVKITANSPDGPLTLELKITEDHNLGKTQLLHKLAAIKLIRELEMEETGMGNVTTIKKEITDLGIRHGIASKYTSYIAVDDSNQKEIISGEMKVRKVPSQLPRARPCGRSSVAKSCPPKSCGSGKKRKQTAPPRPPARSAKKRCMAKSKRKPPPQSKSDASDDSDDDASENQARATPQPSNAQKVTKIINQQNFDGSFCLTEVLCQAIGLSCKDVKAEAKKRGLDEKFWITALTVACFKTTALKNERELWDLVVKKTEKWMAKQYPDATILQAIMEDAAKTFKKA